MKLKLIEADNLANILTNNIKDTNGLVGYKLSRNLRILNDELQDYYKIKLELFAKYGEQDNENLIIKKDSKNYPLFMKEIKQYQEEEIEVEFRNLTEEDIANSNLNGEFLYQIDKYMIGG